MTDRVLTVLFNRRPAGLIVQDHAGRLSLSYDDAWRAAPDATPLSLSMPIARRVHEDAVVRAFLWGLLPDNEQVLERWGRAYHVSDRNPFALLRHVGEDCAGAAQFVVADRIEQLTRGEGGVLPVDDDEIAERIRILRRDPAAWHLANTGQFSLAGAQAKTALHRDPTTGRWGDPRGAVPTTHILKPAVSGFDDHDLNEHLCLEAARLIGLAAARSRVASFGDERVIVVDRYDRVRGADDVVVRVHQEDVCQALGVLPTGKYQNEGGPSPEQVIELFRHEISPPDAAATSIARFVDVLAYNWLIAGTDAYAKNYSVLLAGRHVRLAPLYDVASALPYRDMYLPRLRMAMRIGGEYRIEGIAGRHWARFATDNGLESEAILARIDALAVRLPEAFAQVARAPAVTALDSDLPDRLLGLVTARMPRCRAALNA